MNNKLLIPEKIKIGYQEREDTYTKKLAYVIYYDSKGTLRKEGSWETWRDKKIPFDDYDNVPTEGFVLNKGVGGQRQSYGWNARNEYIRVYDPRGFEFEISVSNLLFILQECTSTKGKGLEGEFVYSWSGKELVLLPVTSQEYKVSTEFTDLQSTKVSARDLKPGYSYLKKDMNSIIYLGRFMYYSTKHINNSSKGYITDSKKGHIFYDDETFVHYKSMNKLAKVNSSEEVSNYADLMDKYNNSKHCSPVVDIVATNRKINFNKEGKKTNMFHNEKDLETFLDNEDGSYTSITISENRNYRTDYKVVDGYEITLDYVFTLKNGKLEVLHGRDVYYNRNEESVIYHPKLKHLTKVLTNKSSYYKYYYYTLEQINSIDYVDVKMVNGYGKKIDADRFTEIDY